MKSASLPIWGLWLQAFAVPIIAAFGAYIAHEQRRIAQRRLQYDLFDRRFVVYSAAMDFIGHVFRHGSADRKTLSDFVNGTSGATFLFGDDVTTLFDDMFKHAGSLHIRSRLDNTESSSNREILAIANEDLRWFLGRRAELDAKFKP